MDDRYTRVQSSISAAAAPALNLWKGLEEQGFTRGKGNLMPVDSTLDIIQRTLVLTGNASNYISQCRCDSIISKVKLKNSRLGSTLSDICQEHQPDDKNLFGSEVRKVLSERAESLSAMKKLSSKLETPGRQGGVEIPSFFERALPPIAAGGRAEFSDRNPNSQGSSTRTPESSPARAQSQPRSSNSHRLSVSSILSHGSQQNSS